MSSPPVFHLTIDTLSRELLEDLLRGSRSAAAQFWEVVTPHIERLVRRRPILGALARDTAHRREAQHEVMANIDTLIETYLEQSRERSDLRFSDWLEAGVRRIARRYKRWYLKYQARHDGGALPLEELAAPPSCRVQPGSASWAAYVTIMDYAREHLPDQQYCALQRWLDGEEAAQTASTRCALARLRRQFASHALS